MNDKLKPCPFCGGKAIYTDNYNGDGTGHSVYCDNCGAGGAIITGASPELILKLKAIEAWNTRTPCPECIKED